MAYFNTKLAKSRELHPIDIFVLQLIHQNKTQDMSEDLALIMDDDIIKRIYSFDLVTMIKGTKKMDEFQRLRLSKKGKKYLDDFQMYEVVENDIKLYDSLEGIYLNEGKEIGSKKKTIGLIAWFRLETGFTHRQIWYICRSFVLDETRMKYSHILEYVFWRKDNNFQVKPKLEDSKLWSFYEENKQQLDNEFKKLE